MSAILAHLMSFFLAAPAVDSDSDFAPKFCNGLNCPNFTVTDRCNDGSGNVIEIREYLAATFVGSNFQGPVTAELWESSSRPGFFNAFDYINGKNAENLKIDMTVPVQRLVFPGATAKDNSTLRLSFFLPYEFQAVDGGKKPPAPTDPAVTVQTQGKVTLAVRAFGGFTSKFNEEVKPQAEVLVNQLKQAKIDFTESFLIVQGYDRPSTTENRHNEVAYLLKSGTKCA